MNVELNIKEMLELGKKAQAAGKGGNADGDNVSIGSRYWLSPRRQDGFVPPLPPKHECDGITMSPLICFWFFVLFCFLFGSLRSSNYPVLTSSCE